MLLPMHHGASFAILEADYCSQEAVTELGMQVARTTNVHPARNFCASRTAEDSIQAIPCVPVALQAGGRFQVQRNEYQGGSIMSVVGVAARFTLRLMVSTVD
jgi:hypothetical protein